MLGLPGGVEWIVIGGIALLLFGKRLPEVMRSIGKGITEFKRGMRNVTDEVTSLTDVEATPRPIEAPKDEEEDTSLDEAFDEEEGYEEEGAEEEAEDDEDTDDQAQEEPATKEGKDLAG